MLPTSGRTELRKDPATNRWVLVRREMTADPGNGNLACPFCPGNEAATASEIAAYRTNGQPANSPEWLVRVIPERAPLMQIEGDIQREGRGIFDWVSGRGASEILIEHPDHQASWTTMSLGEVERILWMYRQRLEDLYRDRQIRCVLIHRCDQKSGPGNGHPISRILGAPLVFDDIREELKAARDHYARKQRCLYCDILQQEISDAARLADDAGRFVVYCPYGSRRPYETWIVPLTHRHRFEETSPPEMTELANVLQATMRRLHAIRPDDPVEMVLHTSPNAGMRLRDDEWQSLAEDYHWHIELAPVSPASDSMGGFPVNPIPPELAARRLRSAL
jgi:UDPglucose--hexose-1-phosphate uridylyltransferase